MFLLFIRRSANVVAHYLARASCYVADRKLRSVDTTQDRYNRKIVKLRIHTSVKWPNQNYTKPKFQINLN